MQTVSNGNQGCIFVFPNGTLEQVVACMSLINHVIESYEPPHGKTNNLHRRKKKAQISFAVTAKLISAFVFTTRIVQFLFFLKPKFQSS